MSKFSTDKSFVFTDWKLWALHSLYRMPTNRSCVTFGCLLRAYLVWWFSDIYSVLKYIIYTVYNIQYIVYCILCMVYAVHKYIVQWFFNLIFIPGFYSLKFLTYKLSKLMLETTTSRWSNVGDDLINSLSLPNQKQFRKDQRCW